jgi:hypothetical protein
MSDLITDPKKWLLELLYNANKTDTETFRIYKCLSRYINDKREFTGILEEVIPTVLRFKPLNDLADDCFFSVSVMPDVINSRYRRRGAPDITFYSNMGKSAYSKIGYNNISHNWSFWVSYVGNNLRLHK